MKSNGERLELRDLAPGNVVKILGREIHIFDADKFTRDYFRYVWLPFPWLLSSITLKGRSL